MHPRIIAQRTGDAQNRAMEASKIVAARWGIPAPVAGEGRYNDINEMMTWEAIAGFIESLATVSIVRINEVEAVPNLYVDADPVEADQQSGKADADPVEVKPARKKVAK